MKIRSTAQNSAGDPPYVFQYFAFVFILTMLREFARAEAITFCDVC